RPRDGRPEDRCVPRDGPPYSPCRRGGLPRPRSAANRIGAWDGPARYPNRAPAVPPRRSAARKPASFPHRRALPIPSCLTLFLTRRRVQEVVEDQAVAGRILVEGKVGRRIAHRMGVILRIMPAIIGELALPDVPVQVAHGVLPIGFAQYSNRFLDQFG